MKIEIREVINKKEKEEISKEVLYDLPEQFGLPKSTKTILLIHKINRYWLVM